MSSVRRNPFLFIRTPWCGAAFFAISTIVITSFLSGRGDEIHQTFPKSILPIARIAMILVSALLILYSYLFSKQGLKAMANQPHSSRERFMKYLYRVGWASAASPFVCGIFLFMFGASIEEYYAFLCVSLTSMGAWTIYSLHAFPRSEKSKDLK